MARAGIGTFSPSSEGTSLTLDITGGLEHGASWESAHFHVRALDLGQWHCLSTLAGGLRMHSAMLYGQQGGQVPETPRDG